MSISKKEITIYPQSFTSGQQNIANNKYYTMIEATYTGYLSNNLYYHLTSPYIVITYPTGFVFNNNDYLKVVNYHYRVQFLRSSKASSGPY